MTLYDFNSLDFKEQLTIVYDVGVFIENHITENRRCNLYAIEMFFVELTYNTETNSVTEIKSFKAGYLLDKYSNI
jgi:hypothetical protein